MMAYSVSAARVPNRQSPNPRPNSRTERPRMAAMMTIGATNSHVKLDANQYR
jgi:hypothetical protein